MTTDNDNHLVSSAISANGPAADRPILTVLIGSLRPPKSDRKPVGANFSDTNV
jgi:hypothetical protein